jgi:hypothetical protein
MTRNPLQKSYVSKPSDCLLRACGGLGGRGLIGAKCYQLSAGLANPAAALFVRNQKNVRGQNGRFFVCERARGGIGGIWFRKGCKTMKNENAAGVAGTVFRRPEAG